jgi:hypothetical protein
MLLRQVSIRTLPLFAVAVAVGMLSRGANAEVLTFDSRSPAPQYTQPLTPGVAYIAEASGTFWMNATLHVDSCFAFDNVPPYPGSYGPYELNYLLVDEQQVDWQGSPDGANWTAHTYSPDHIYRYPIMGQGQPVAFRLYDSPYSDNSGTFQVAITAVPEPASLALVGVGAAALLMGRRARR